MKHSNCLEDLSLVTTVKHVLHDYISIKTAAVLCCSGEYNFLLLFRTLFQFAMYVVVLPFFGVFRQALLLSPSLYSQIIAFQLTRPNKPFNVYRRSFAFPSSGCFVKLSYILRHCFPRTDSQIIHPNISFNMFVLSFAVPPLRCLNKLFYCLRHLIPRT